MALIKQFFMQDHQKHSQNSNKILSYLRPFSYNKKVWIPAAVAIVVIIMGLIFVLS